MSKQELYKTFIQRMEAALDAGYHLEASWYAYAILEDRLISMLRNTGGVPLVSSGRNKGKPIQMLGRKLAELQKRSKTTAILQQIEFASIQNWANQRNDLMHAMAEGSKPLKAVDKEAFLLAQTGVTVVRDCASAARRVKKNLGRLP